ncbi:MAG TPA: proton-conducting transporter membrane subunit [Verrucomicrobiae bacterium]|nr:proton-conducting transporter membrane subunit [Verrucomicrobiae bacterium]
MMLLVILALPLVAMALCWIPLGRSFAPSVTLLAAASAFVLAISAGLQTAAGNPVVAIPHWAALDGFSALILLLVTLAGATSALFSWGYMERSARSDKRLRLYYVHFNLFLFALIAVPSAVEPNIEWIALELTALFSVLLVAYENTHESLEAAWKYITLMFMGAAIALFGFLILFWAFKTGGGETYTWEGLRAAAPQMPPVLVKTAFLMILVGFGIKVGFVPVHTWLPDAHSQAPSPVCALLSGVKTTTALYVILRLLPLLSLSDMQEWLLTIGLISVGVAAFLLLQVRDYKRLFAYSTVEHMGIIFTAAGIGAAGGHYGAMMQILTHSITKSFCFLAAGAALLAVDTRQIASVRGLIRTSPAAGAALLFGGLAIAGAPPFAVFLSEFSILRAGLTQGRYLVTALLALFIAIAFFSILVHINGIVFGRPDGNPSPPRAHLPFSCVLALVLAAVPIVVFGVYLPEPLHQLLGLAAAALAK